MLCFISSQLLGQYRNFDGAVLCDGMNDYDYYLRKGTIAIDIGCQKCFTNKICQQKYVIYMLFEIFLNVPCTVSFFLSPKAYTVMVDIYMFMCKRKLEFQPHLCTKWFKLRMCYLINASTFRSCGCACCLCSS